MELTEKIERIRKYGSAVQEYTRSLLSLSDAVTSAEFDTRMRELDARMGELIVVRKKCEDLFPDENGADEPRSGGEGPSVPG